MRYLLSTRGIFHLLSTEEVLLVLKYFLSEAKFHVNKLQQSFTEKYNNVSIIQDPVLIQMGIIGY